MTLALRVQLLVPLLPCTRNRGGRLLRRFRARRQNARRAAACRSIRASRSARSRARHLAKRRFLSFAAHCCSTSDRAFSTSAASRCFGVRAQRRRLLFQLRGPLLLDLGSASDRGDPARHQRKLPEPPAVDRRSAARTKPRGGLSAGFPVQSLLDLGSRFQEFRCETLLGIGPKGAEIVLKLRGPLLVGFRAGCEHAGGEALVRFALGQRRLVVEPGRPFTIGLGPRPRQLRRQALIGFAPKRRDFDLETGRPLGLDRFEPRRHGLVGLGGYLVAGVREGFFGTDWRATPGAHRAHCGAARGRYPTVPMAERASQQHYRGLDRI